MKWVYFAVFLVVSSLMPRHVFAADVDISAMPTTIGTATSTDEIVAYDSSAAEGSRIAGIPFSSIVTQWLNGQGGWTAPVAADISDFDTEVANNSAVTANSAKVTYPGSADATEINILDGAMITTTELNYLDGSTENIQDALDTIVPSTGGTFTSNVTMSTASVPFLFEESDQADGYAGKYWRMVHDAGDIRFDIDTNANGAYSSTSVPIKLWSDATVSLRYGAQINEFSTDDTLAGDSDSAVPTEQAVKGAIDTALDDTVSKSAGGTFDSSVMINLPSDYWLSTLGWFQPYGGIFSNGSYAVTLLANGYRNSSGTWTSMEVNSSTAAAGIDLMTSSGDIRFYSEDAWASGLSYSLTPRMTLKGDTNNFLIGTTTDNGTDKLQVNGSASVSSDLDVGGSIILSSGTSVNEIATTLDGTSDDVLLTEGAIDTAIDGVLVANAVEESHLKAVDAAADEECLTYEASTGDFEWQTCGSESVDTTGTPANNQVAIFTDADTLEGDADLTFDGTDLTVGGDLEADGGTFSGTDGLRGITPGQNTSSTASMPDNTLFRHETTEALTYKDDDSVEQEIAFKRMRFNSYAAAQTLTAAAHNASIVRMTVAGEVTMWDCETANIGDNVGLWARDAEKIEVVPASGDNFVLFDGTALDANDELDMDATAGTKVSLVCTADDEWSVYTETAECTDGGTAD